MSKMSKTSFLNQVILSEKYKSFLKPSAPVLSAAAAIMQ